MRLYKADKVIIPVPTLNITNEMIKHHHDRTNEHIDRVISRATEIERKFKKHKGVKEQARKHDQSKFESPELNPYILLSWKKKCEHEKCPCKFSPIQLKAIKKASLRHITKNIHHPECHMLVRDVEEQKLPLDATKMPTEAIVELCADWQAIADELGTDALDWADNVIGNKYTFTKEQISDIYEILNAFNS